MGALHDMTLLELGERLRSRAVSPVEVVEAQLRRIEALDRALSSFATVMADEAMAAARTAETEIADGRWRGPLHGVPIGVKDLFWTKDVPTAAGAAVHRDFRPAEDATAVRRLREAGAIVLGKLQMTEGAYSDHHPSVTPPKNPWDPALWPSISSSGPGVALAAGLCFGALASDTGGSIRWPSAQNGVTGLKPTWGRVSRHGAFELAASLDHVGPMALSAFDAGVMLDAIAGPDPRDPTALQAPPPGCPRVAPDSLKGLRIGVDRAWNEDGVDPLVARAVAEAAAVLSELGGVIVEVAAPEVSAAIADWPANCAVEAAVAHAATYPSRKNEYGAVLASVIEAGDGLSGPDYQRILLRRMALKGEFAALWRTIDLLLTPVHPFRPLTLAEIRTLGERPELVAKLQRFTCPFDMTGSPTITLPGGHDEAGAPIGVQLVGPDLAEASLVAAGAAFQAATRWHLRRPSLRPS